jgi:Transposase, Mutator family
MAFEVVKAMQAEGLDWGEGYRRLGRQALQEIIEDQMAAAVDRHLDRLEAEDAADRRNGYYRRHLLTELDDIELNVPRTRRYSPTAVIRAYARRTREIDRVILAGFVLGLSTRKVGETLLALLGRSVSPSTVSEVAKTLDAGVAAFHRRPLLPSADARRRRTFPQDRRRRPAQASSRRFGAAPRRQEGDHRLPLGGERKRRRMERFLADLYRRGLTGEGLDMICVDGSCGKIMNATNAPAARAAARKSGSCAPSSVGRRCRGRSWAGLLPLQIGGPTPQSTNHQCDRTTLPRSTTADQAHGYFPGPHIHGPHPVRRLHPRKQVTGP